MGLAEAPAALAGHWPQRGPESTLRRRKRASLVWFFKAVLQVTIYYRSSTPDSFLEESTSPELSKADGKGSPSQQLKRFILVVFPESQKPTSINFIMM